MIIKAAEGHKITPLNLKKPEKKYYKKHKYLQTGGIVKPSFEDYYKTIPVAKNDTTGYNLRRAYELFPYQDMVRFAKDPEFHLGSVAPLPDGNYEFLKKKTHPTYKMELDWYNSKEGAKFKKAYKLDETGEYSKYIRNGNKYQEGGKVKFGNNIISSSFEKAYWNKSETDSLQKQLDFTNNWFNKRVVHPNYGAPTKLESLSAISPVHTKQNMGKNVYGHIDKNEPNEIFFNKTLNHDKGSTPVHEYSHLQQNRMSKDEFFNKITYPVSTYLNKDRYNNSKDYKYEVDPAEMQSRLMEFRYLNNLDPTKKVEIDKNGKDSKIHNLKSKSFKYPDSGYLKDIPTQELENLLNNVASNNKTIESEFYS